MNRNEIVKHYLEKFEGKDRIGGGKADKKKVSDFDRKALKEGAQHELEHTTDKTIAREIASDHLAEDPSYYKKLKAIEKSAERPVKSEQKWNGVGWISPHGKFLPLRQDIRSQLVSNHPETHGEMAHRAFRFGNDPYDSIEAAHRAGWIAIGHAGAHVISGHSRFMGHDSPAIQEAKRVSTAHFSESPHIDIYHNDTGHHERFYSDVWRNMRGNSLGRVAQVRLELGKTDLAKNDPDDAYIDRALGDEDKGVRRIAISHPSATSAHIDRALQDKDEDVRYAAIVHPNATSAHIDRALGDEDENVRYAAIKHPSATSAHIDRALGDKDKYVRYAAIVHPNATSAHIDRALGDEDKGVRLLANSATKLHEPERHAGNTIDVAHGSEHLRQIRSIVAGAGGTVPKHKFKELGINEHHVKSLWDHKGNLTEKTLSDHIDKLPKHRYTWSETKFDGDQRHSTAPSKVFQLNLANHHVDQMKQSGVHGSFANIARASQRSRHPSDLHTIGWVRYTGHPKTGIHVDEIQSDLGTSLRRQHKQLTEQGHDIESKIPLHHIDKINHIVFGGHHPSDVLLGAFKQHLRNKGHHDTSIHVNGPELKEKLARSKVPESVYRDTPKRFGMKQDSYGKLRTQNNPDHKGMQTWSQKINKTERLDQAARLMKGDEPSPAERFMRAWHAETSQNPIMAHDRLHGMTTSRVYVAPGKSNRVHLSSIQSIEPRQGHATKTLKRLGELADQHGVEIEAYVKPYGVHPDFMKKRHLMMWYRKHGYRSKKVDRNQIIRAPQKQIDMGLSKSQHLFARGWISPKGDYHPIPNDHIHTHVSAHTKFLPWKELSEEEAQYPMEAFHKRGWVALGHGQDNNISGSSTVVNDSKHPAMLTARKLAARHHSPDAGLEIEASDLRRDHPDGFRRTTMKAFASHGNVAPRGKIQAIRNDPMMKWTGDAGKAALAWHGVIDPQGQFHPLGDARADHLGHLFGVAGVSGTQKWGDQMRHREERRLLGEGYVMTGHGGGTNASIDEDVFKQTNHPAMRTLRNLADRHMRHHSSSILISHGPGREYDIGIDHFVRHGTRPVSKVAQARMLKNDPMMKMIEDGEKAPPYHGIIDPKGNFIKLGPEEYHHEARYDHAKKNKFNEKEYLHVGAGGNHNVIGYSGVLKQPDHPAMKTARKIAAKYFNDDMEIGEWNEENSDDDGYHEVTRDHFVRHGTIPRPGSVAQARMLKNDPVQSVVDIHGLLCYVEWPRGSTRAYRDGYSRYMRYDYGYIAKSPTDDDGEELDCYIGPDHHSKKCFVIEQVRPDTGKYDEQKIMLGFASAEQAKTAYLEQMTPKHFGQIRETSIEAIRDRLDRTPKPHDPKGMYGDGGKYQSDTHQSTGAPDQDAQLKKGLSPRTLSQIDSGDWQQRKMLTRKKSLPSRYVDRLVTDKDPAVRQGLTFHPGLKPHHLDRLVSDSAHGVRWGIAKRQDLKPHHLDRLATDKESTVRESVAQRKDLGPHHIDKLVADPDVAVRTAIVGHPGLKQHHLDHLSRDPHEHIRNVATKRLKSPLRKSVSEKLNDYFAQQTSGGLHPHAYEWHDTHTQHHVNQALDLGKIDGPVKNEQVAGPGESSLYHQIAKPYGHIMHGQRTNLFHFPGLERHEQAIDKMIAHHGYRVVYAGGKYGPPKLNQHNYNTKHLMVYDPSPGSGGDSGQEAYTRSWRKIHELSHALTYPEINRIYGEGRRLGALGKHRSIREAQRAVHWEHLAIHKQRELMGKIGHHMTDEEFGREYNTVLHDAVHRAITGKFTEPSQEGFEPHSRPAKLKGALDTIREHGKRMGLQSDEHLLTKTAGHIDFPGLGVASKHGHQPMMIPEKNVSRYRNLMARLSGYSDVNRDDVKGMVTGKMKMDNPIPKDQSRIIGHVYDTNLGTEQHEKQHIVFNRIGAKFGLRVRRQLAHHLFNQLPDHHKAILRDNVRAEIHHDGLDHHPEELISHLHNYVNDPHRRTIVNRDLSDPESALATIHVTGEERHRHAKQAMKTLQRAAKKITLNDIERIKHNAPK